VLAGVAVLEVVLGIGPLELHAPAHGSGGAFALVQPGEVAQVAVAVRAGDVGGEPAGAVDLQHALEVTAAVAGELGLAAVAKADEKDVFAVLRHDALCVNHAVVNEVFQVVGEGLPDDAEGAARVVVLEVFDVFQHEGQHTHRACGVRRPR
jgi:hypothetical protein